MNSMTEIKKEFSDLQEISAQQGSICRICLQTQQISLPLISPCRCSGSVKFVHPECMKTWIISQNDQIAGAKCQLCHTELLMDFTLTSKCSVSQACQQKFSNIVFAPLLVSVQILLGMIIFILISELVQGDLGEDQQAYLIIVLCVCALAFIIVTLLTMKAFKQVCIVRTIKQWEILSQNFDDTIEMTEEVNTYIQTQPVMVMPSFVRVHGRQVQRPQIAPATLTPVSRNGNIVAFVSNTPQNQSLNNSVHGLDLSVSWQSRSEIPRFNFNRSIEGLFNNN